jgi:hypothetical protein
MPPSPTTRRRRRSQSGPRSPDRPRTSATITEAAYPSPVQEARPRRSSVVISHLSPTYTQPCALSRARAHTLAANAQAGDNLVWVALKSFYYTFRFGLPWVTLFALIYLICYPVIPELCEIRTVSAWTRKVAKFTGYDDLCEPVYLPRYPLCKHEWFESLTQSSAAYWGHEDWCALIETSHRYPVPRLSKSRLLDYWHQLGEGDREVERLPDLAADISNSALQLYALAIRGTSETELIDQQGRLPNVFETARAVHDLAGGETQTALRTYALCWHHTLNLARNGSAFVSLAEERLEGLRNFTAERGELFNTTITWNRPPWSILQRYMSLFNHGPYPALLGAFSAYLNELYSGLKANSCNSSGMHALKSYQKLGQDLQTLKTQVQDMVKPSDIRQNCPSPVGSCNDCPALCTVHWEEYLDHSRTTRRKGVEMQKRLGELVQEYDGFMEEIVLTQAVLQQYLRSWKVDFETVSVEGLFEEVGGLVGEFRLLGEVYERNYWERFSGL